MKASAFCCRHKGGAADGGVPGRPNPAGPGRAAGKPSIRDEEGIDGDYGGAADPDAGPLGERGGGRRLRHWTTLRSTTQQRFIEGVGKSMESGRSAVVMAPVAPLSRTLPAAGCRARPQPTAPSLS